jgi:hypothetical protein
MGNLKSSEILKNVGDFQKIVNFLIMGDIENIGKYIGKFSENVGKIEKGGKF